MRPAASNQSVSQPASHQSVSQPASHPSVRRVVEAGEQDDDDDSNDTETAQEEEPKQKRITGEMSDYTRSSDLGLVTLWVVTSILNVSHWSMCPSKSNYSHFEWSLAIKVLLHSLTV